MKSLTRLTLAAGLIALGANPLLVRAAEPAAELKRASELVAAKKPDEAKKVYLDLYGDSGVPEAKRLYAAQMAGKITEDAYDMDGAREIFEEAIKRFPAGKNADVDAAIFSLRQRLAGLEIAVGQKEKAIAILTKTLTESKKDADIYHATLTLTKLYTDMGDYLAGLAACRSLLKMKSGYWKAMALPCRALAAQLPCDEKSEKLLREVLIELYRCESNADSAVTVEALKACIVQLELLVGDYAQAQYDAFVLTEMASTKPSLEDGVKLLVAATKAVDGHMGRANEYLAYQNARAALKPGEPVPRNPLRGMKPVTSPERLAIFEERIKKIKVTDWSSRLERARVLQAMGKLGDALVELDQAYKECPIEKASMQRVVDQTADVLLQVSGDPTVGQRLVDYLRFGEAGPDTKKGTGDDVVDPRGPYMPGFKP